MAAAKLLPLIAALLMSLLSFNAYYLWGKVEDHDMGISKAKVETAVVQEKIDQLIKKVDKLDDKLDRIEREVSK
jgi:ubiquinone biosynthesis protein UbiJ